MIAHMLRDRATGLYYQRSHGCGPSWVEQKRASIWTSRVGPAAALRRCREYAWRNKRPDTFEIVDFTLSEIVAW